MREGRNAKVIHRKQPMSQSFGNIEDTEEDRKEPVQKPATTRKYCKLKKN